MLCVLVALPPNPQGFIALWPKEPSSRCVRSSSYRYHHLHHDAPSRPRAFGQGSKGGGVERKGAKAQRCKGAKVQRKPRSGKKFEDCPLVFYQVSTFQRIRTIWLSAALEDPKRTRAFHSVASTGLCGLCVSVFPCFFFGGRDTSGVGPIPMAPYRVPGNETVTPDPSA